MSMLLPGLVIIVTIALAASGFFLIRLYRQVAALKSSFAKLGYVVRQDLQEYFDQSANKVLDIQQQSVEQQQQAIEQTMQKVLDESSQVIQKTLARAEKQASTIILKAHNDRQQILDDARKESQQYLRRLTDYSSEALEWSMEQLMKEKIDLNGHEELVRSLVSVYLDEHKQS